MVKQSRGIKLSHRACDFCDWIFLLFLRARMCIYTSSLLECASKFSQVWIVEENFKKMNYNILSGVQKIMFFLYPTLCAWCLCWLICLSCRIVHFWRIATWQHEFLCKLGKILCNMILCVEFDAKL